LEEREEGNLSRLAILAADVRFAALTLSVGSRRFEIAAGIAYGTRLADVLALRADVAKKHPAVRLVERGKGA
jgi:hypothetical protein